MPLPLSSSLRIGISALRLNPLRTLLSALGVIIGVGAMVSVLSLTDGVERELRTQIERDGRMQSIRLVSRTEDMVDGQAIPRSSFHVFTHADAIALSSAVGATGAVYLGVSGAGLITADWAVRSAPRAATVAATLSNGAENRRLMIRSGRFFNDAEVGEAARVVVLSHELARAMTGADSAVSSTVGRTVQLQNQSWTVIGVLAPAAVEGGSPSRPSLTAFVPVSTAHVAMVESRRPLAPAFLLKAATVEAVPEMQRRAEVWLGARFGAWKESVTVASYAQEGEQVRSGMILFRLLAGAITGISLVVGGVGIMNVLLASVTERTREIGVRKVAGARNRDVLTQFLAESVAISGVGGALGTGLGVAVSIAVAAVMRARTGGAVEAGFSLSTLAVAVLAPLVVGIAFGMYPALRASRLTPIDAIRHE